MYGGVTFIAPPVLNFNPGLMSGALTPGRLWVGDRVDLRASLGSVVETTDGPELEKLFPVGQFILSDM
jgi:hypothetical protein